MTDANRPDGSALSEGLGHAQPERAVYELKPAAWIDRSGHPKHLSHIQGVAERRLYGPLEPLYDQQALWNACSRAGDVEREKIKAALMAMHDAHKHQHNYFLCAVQDLFVARRANPSRVA